MKDELGDRMKNNYENRTRFYLNRRTYTIIRIDGKSFHTYTKGFKRPFDDDLMNDMDATAQYLCKNIEGAKLAFVQSDEISILLTDFDTIKTEAWFDNNLQKMTSVSASFATSIFNQLRLLRQCSNPDDNDEYEKWVTTDDILKTKLAHFDSRVFQISQKCEVENYFIFRQKDATRNSIQSVAQSLYSHKELNGKNSSQLQEMIFQKGINWNDYDARYKRGRIILKEYYQKEGFDSLRSKWLVFEPPIFTQDKDYLTNLIPNSQD